MDEREFEDQLQALSDRVLSKALTQEEETNYTESLFESIRHVNEYGEEFWNARELQKALCYKRWDKFLNVIDKAKKACSGSNYPISDHFSHVGKMVNIGSGAGREIEDLELSRYACYLIVMNEDKKRLAIRAEMKIHNKSLAEAAKQAGITEPIDYAIFQNKGYQGLYGGLSQKDIHARKGLKKSQDILDYMGSTELAANLFRATQTDEKLRKEKIVGKDAANQTHYEVGKKVRETIKDLGGTMPEDLPTPNKSIKQIERELRKNIDNK